MTIKRGWSINRANAIHAYEDFLFQMGYPIEEISAMCSKPSGKNTAVRTVDAYIEFFSKEQDFFEFTVFDWSNEQSEEIIAVTHMEFVSMCAHHMLPYMGMCHVGYVPLHKVCGLSKIIRIVDHYSHRPSIQEDLTSKIATFMEEQLQPKGCGVIIEATHLCLAIRGVCRPHHVTVTSDMRGLFKSTKTGQAFNSLIEGARSRVR